MSEPIVLGFCIIAGGINLACWLGFAALIDIRNELRKLRTEPSEINDYARQIAFQRAWRRGDP